MIELRSLSKIYGTPRARVSILRDVSAVFEPGKRYVIFGVRASGKTTLLRVICGMQKPTNGSVRRTGLVSPPVGSAGILQVAEHPLDVVHMYSLLYRVDYKRLLAFVEQFIYEFAGASLQTLKLLTADVPPRIRRALAYALTYGVPADFYLFDDRIAPSDDVALSDWCKRAFEDRRASAGTIFTTRVTRDADKYGEIGGVLHEGRLTLYADLSEAIRAFDAIELDARSGTIAGAELLIRRNQLAEAHEYLRELIVENPKDLGAQKLLANVSARLGDPASSMNILRYVVDRAPEDFEAGYLLARANEQQGEWAQALVICEGLLAVQPSHRGARAIVAKCLERLGRFADAAAQWSLLGTESRLPGDYGAAIRCYVKAKELGTALKTIDVALTLQPRDAILLGIRASILMDLREVDRFKTAIFELATVDPRKALGLTAEAASKLDPQTTAILLSGLHELGALAMAQGTEVERIVVRLGRAAKVMAQEDNIADAEDIRRLIDRVQTAGLKSAGGAADSTQ